MSFPSDDRPNDPGNENSSPPIDKFRMALIHGACGPPDRLLVRGQIADIPVTRTQKAEEWDPLLAVPLSQKTRLRPIQDMGLRGVRRARLQIEIFRLTDPDDRPDRAQLQDAPALFTSPEVIAESSGFFQTVLKTPLPAGSYYLRVILRGIDSVRQNLSDLTFFGSESMVPKKDIPIGFGPLRVLSPDYRGYYITSDIDQTFLDTRYATNSEMWNTLVEEAQDKAPLPGMAELYRAVQQNEGGPLPLYFLSASPHFFHRTLRMVFDKHDIPFTGLNLKRLMKTFDDAFRRAARNFLDADAIFSQGFSRTLQRSFKYLNSAVDGLFDQVAYKLSFLLENRLYQTTESREILIGDNSESDFFVFILYQYLLSGKMDEIDLENYLYRLKFLERECLTRDAAHEIIRLTQENRALHGDVNPARIALINLARPEPRANEMLALVNKALPSGFELSGPRAEGIAAFQVCGGALGIALHLLELELLDLDALETVWRSMEGRNLQGETIGPAYLERTLSDVSPRGYSRAEIRARLT